MTQQLMWSNIDRVYRGQTAKGTIITVDEDAMQTALKKAGNGVLEPDWWVETLTNVLQHWGIESISTMDYATQVPMLRYSATTSQSEPAVVAAESITDSNQTTSLLRTRLLSGTLTTKTLSDDPTSN